MLKEGGSFRNKWPVGKIKQTYPGKEGQVRVVLVKTNAGTYRFSTTTRMCESG